METRLAPLAEIFDLNTDLLLNCLDGVSDGEARQRVGGQGNSILFLAAHLSDSRHFLAAQLEHPLDNPLSSVLAKARRIEDVRAWPPLTEVTQAWCTIGAHLKLALRSLDSGDLAKATTMQFPVGDSTRLGMIAFLAQHESYHVGQLGFLRCQLGKPAMTYDRRT